MTHETNPNYLGCDLWVVSVAFFSMMFFGVPSAVCFSFGAYALKLSVAQ